jgi:hypothetical protein
LQENLHRGVLLCLIKIIFIMHVYFHSLNEVIGYYLPL